MTFVHCCTSSDAELDLSAAHRASACVTPAVEANMPGLGVPATGRLLAREVRPALGVDVEVTGVGRLSNKVVEAPAPRAAVGFPPSPDSDGVRTVALGNEERLPDQFKK